MTRTATTCVREVILSEDSHGHRHVSASKSGVKQKLQKVLVVLNSYTSSNPRAVMIHSQNANITNRAMMSPRRLQNPARFTPPILKQINDIGSDLIPIL